MDEAQTVKIRGLIFSSVLFFFLHDLYSEANNQLLSQDISESTVAKIFFSSLEKNQRLSRSQ